MKARCMHLRAADGSERFIPMGTSYMLRPSEVKVGVSESCGDAAEDKPVSTPHDPTLIQELDAAVGGGKGDWIKAFFSPFAKLMGKSGCSSCEARRIATNAYANLKARRGQEAALTIIKDLWKMSFTASGDEVLLELKKYLAGEK